ncbi:Phosphotransferase enzyme [Ophidiomyces ophidiicola]|nr:Phosphotransferase enzyme [Ophidiomyces ophidiicola]
MDKRNARVLDDKTHYPSSKPGICRGSTFFYMTDSAWALRDDSPDYYRYTGGRWLFNEAEQLAARRVEFNLDALVAVAIKSLGQEHISCSKVEKLPEGNFNKSLLLTMTDGSQLVARVPNPNSGLPHYTTASEVATMDFAISELDIPVPKVLAWHSRAAENQVGAEYIIMEKAAGSCLSNVWPTLNNQQKRDIIQAVVKFEIKFLSNPFGGIGSLYYPKDVPRGTKVIPAASLNKAYSRWILGPTTDRRFFDDDKGKLSLDRGPWRTAHEYVGAVCRREMEAIQDPKRVLRPEGIVGPGGYQPDRALKLSVCHDFLKVASHLLPLEACQISVLWHHDLHLGNIFVDPENPTKIAGLIDWQSVHVAPLFYQATHPSFLNYIGPIPKGLKVSLPDNFDELNEEAKNKAKKLLVEQSLYKFYDAYSALLNKRVYQALEYQQTLQGQIVALIGTILLDAEPAVQALLMELATKWNQINSLAGIPCPLEYSNEAVERNRKLEMKWAEGILLMDDVLESLGGAERGWKGYASHAEYELLKQKLSLVREQFVEYWAGQDKEAGREWESAWPFK